MLILAGAMSMVGCEKQPGDVQDSMNAENQENTLPSRSPVAEGDRLALEALYRSAMGEDWHRNDNWMREDTELKDWYGVKTAVVDGEERVVSLRLGGNRLVGELPHEIGNLTALEVLDLSDNYRLGGEIPEELYNLKNLRVWKMRFSDVHGELSSAIGNLTQIDSLELWGAPWDLERPGFVAKAPNTLLSGRLPEELGRLTKASYIVLGRNNFEGEIPASVGNLENLRYFDIARCRLEGELPATLGNLKNLSTLFVSGNRLVGEIPAEMGQMESLKEFYGDENAFTGTIPASFANLKNLLRLSLCQNQLSGKLPEVASRMEHLGLLYLDDNRFEGEIPAELGGKQQPLLVSVALRNNNLTGNLPRKVAHDYIVDGVNHGVVYTMFYVSGNKLSGKIPAEYFMGGELQEDILPQQAGYDLVK